MKNSIMAYGKKKLLSKYKYLHDFILSSEDCREESTQV